MNQQELLDWLQTHDQQLLAHVDQQMQTYFETLDKKLATHDAELLDGQNKKTVQRVEEVNNRIGTPYPTSSASSLHSRLYHLEQQAETLTKTLASIQKTLDRFQDQITGMTAAHLPYSAFDGHGTRKPIRELEIAFLRTCGLFLAQMEQDMLAHLEAHEIRQAATLRALEEERQHIEAKRREFLPPLDLHEHTDE